MLHIGMDLSRQRLDIHGMDDQGAMRVVDLTKAHQASGKLLRTESAYATLHKTLARDRRFIPVPG